MIESPETQYARAADGAHIAYQVVGDGPVDLVFKSQDADHLEMAWEMPALAGVYERLASFSRLIRFDYRGSGLSDPLGLSEQPSIEQRAGELLAVLDAIGSEQAALVANSTAGLAAIFFAASYPHRVASLVLDGCYARLARAPDYPWGVPLDVLSRAVDRTEKARVDAAGDSAHEIAGLRYVAPNAAQDAEFVAQWRRFSRNMSRPGNVRALSEMLVHGDVRPVLSAIQARTLVLYRKGDQWVGKPHAVYLADHIDGARLVELQGEDNLIFVGDSDADLDEIEEFLTGSRHAPVSDRVLTTVCFTDIVSSTEKAADLGDRKWSELLDAHDRAVRRQLERFRGREVNTAGDGFVTTFDGPGRAIECACAIRASVRAIGLDVRIGLHTGEVEVRGDDIAGMAVHIAARVAAVAGAGEVLVSGAVPPLVAGSGIDFTDRGEHELKGVPGTWRLFAVTE